MTAPPPPPLYLKVWIRRCHVSKSCYLLDELQLPSLLYYKCIAFPKRPCDIFLKSNQLQSSQTVFLIIFFNKVVMSKSKIRAKQNLNYFFFF